MPKPMRARQSSEQLIEPNRSLPEELTELGETFTPTKCVAVRIVSVRLPRTWVQAWVQLRAILVDFWDVSHPPRRSDRSDTARLAFLPPDLIESYSSIACFVPSLSRSGVRVPLNSSYRRTVFMTIRSGGRFRWPRRQESGASQPQHILA